jgi:drug/metabolite transporter (DMT)-like permease
MSGSDWSRSDHGRFKRTLFIVAGFVLCAVGVVLLVLPGPGLLLVLGGLVLLSNEFEWAHRFTEPVRERAWQAAIESVASPLRIGGSVLAGLALIAAGVVWIVTPSLPFGGAATGSSLILSGVVLFALLVYTYRHVTPEEKAEARRD